MRAGAYAGLKIGLGAIACVVGLSWSTAGRAAVREDVEWRLSTPLPEARAGYAAGVVGGRLILAGGTYWLGSPGAWTEKVFCATTHAFDPGTEIWTCLPDAPVAFGYAAGVALEDRLYVLGGVQAGRSSRQVFVLENQSGAFHWREGPALPEARVFAEAAVAQGKIFVVGGSREFETLDDTGLCCGTNTATTTVWSWDPANPSSPWKERTPFPGDRRGGHRLVSDGRYLYQFGGRFLTGKGQPLHYFNDVWRYDVQSDQWTKLAEMPVGVQLARAVFADGKILLIGRDRRAMKFDPVTDGFTNLTGLPEDALVDSFFWLPPFIVGAGGETKLDRPRRRANWTFLGRWSPTTVLSR